MLEKHVQFWGVPHDVEKGIVMTKVNTPKLNCLSKTYENHFIREKNQQPHDFREKKIMNWFDLFYDYQYIGQQNLNMIRN